MTSEIIVKVKCLLFYSESLSSTKRGPGVSFLHNPETGDWMSRFEKDHLEMNLEG